MPNLTPTDFYTTQFYVWEQRGRGTHYFPNPVDIEPEFIPFFGHVLPQKDKPIDDGLRPRILPSLTHRFSKWLKGEKEENFLEEEKALNWLEELYPLRAYNAGNPEPNIIELHLVFPQDTRVGFEYIEELLLLISKTSDPISFEIIAFHEQIRVQLACTSEDVFLVSSYVSEYLPKVVVHQKTNTTFAECIDYADVCLITELGLGQEFTRPLRMYNRFEPDPLAGILATMDNLQEGECAIFQVLFKGIMNPWAQSMLWAVTDNSGKSFFADDPYMLDLAKEKVSKPLFVACPRIVVYSDSEQRVERLSEAMFQSLSTIGKGNSNEFIPFWLNDFDISQLQTDVFLRRSRRTGIIVNSGELASFVHIPDQTVKAPKMRFGLGKTKELPQSAVGHDFCIGVNEHFGAETLATLSTQHRLRHMHVIGATGTGKSNLLQGCIAQDMQLGNGLCVLDPHGDLIEKVMLWLPDDRLEDVIILDPSDEEFPVGLNLLDAQTEAEKIILSSDLVSLFKRFATSWGDQMTSVLANAINAFLYKEETGTLLELRRFLTETKFRNSILETLSDPSIAYYWKHEFPLLRSNSIAPILTRLDTFLRSRIVRNMMAQKKGLDFHDIINGKKILLVKLSQGLIGEENSYLLGSVIVAKLHQAALHRQNIKEENRSPFFLYIDEFQHFITPSMSAILSGARKYGLGLILAHQDLEQVRNTDRELANSILSNPAVRVYFRTGESDARQLSQSLSHFDENDLQNLGIGNAIARVERKDQDFNVSTSLVENDLSLEEREAKARLIIDYSRKIYGGNRKEIEEQIYRDFQEKVSKSVTEEPKPKKVETKPTPKVEEPVQIRKEEVPAPVARVEPEITDTKPLEEKAQVFIQRVTEKEELREHRYLQEAIKRTGEAFGYKSVIEEPTPDGQGSVDVSLKRDDVTIAIEVAVTNTKVYEVQNIQKCLRAGFDMVVVCSNTEKHLQRIEAEAQKVLSNTELKKVVFYSPDQLTAYIQTTVKPKRSENVVKGYKVEINVQGSGQGAGDVDKGIAKTILNSIKKGR